MWKVTFKGIWAKKLRFLLTAVAVMLGVAFVSGTFVLTATISSTFDQLFSNIYEHTDAVVRAKQTFSGNFGAGRGRIDASLLPVVRRAPGVAQADGTVQGIAAIVDRHDKVLGSNGRGAPTLGFAWIADRDLSSLRVVAGRGPRAPNEIVIDKKSADDAKYRPGDTVPVITQVGRADYRLSGIVKFGTADSPLGATIVAFTPATAARVLAKPGTFDTIEVKAASGVSQNEVVRNIRSTLAAAPSTKNVEVLSGKAIIAESQSNLKDNLSFFNVFLLAFAALALLVGAFIIFNTFSIIVVQRGRELALLRAIGASTEQVLGAVLVEALLVGVTASVLGFVGGILVAGGLKTLLATLGLDIPAQSISIPASAVIWSFVTGVVVTAIAAAVPALRASRIPPVAAMRQSAVEQTAVSRTRLLNGALVTVLGVLLLGLGLFRNAGLASVGIGMLVVFVGVAIVGPTFATPVSRALGAPIRRLKGVTGSIARENAARNPKRTSATAAALMIGVAVVGLLTIFVASARSSLDAAIDRSMKSDYVVNSSGFGPGTIPVTAERDLRALPNVSSVAGVRSSQARIAGDVQLLYAADPKSIDQLFDLRVVQGHMTDLGPTNIGVLDTTASDKGLHLGSRVTVEFPSTGRHVFTVAVIFEQAGFATWITSLATYEANYPDQFDTQIYVKTHGGVTPTNTASLKAVMRKYPGPEVQDRQQFKAAQSAQINPLLTFVYVLVLFSVVIALFGIANTLGLSISERTHEIGLMRAVGMTRAQVRSSVRWESVIIALLGAVLGLLIGVAFAWAMVRALADQGIDHFSLAPAQLLLIAVLACLFGIVAAAWPARRAARLDVLASIQTE